MKQINQILWLFCSLLILDFSFSSCSRENVPAQDLNEQFVKVKGPDLVKPDGTKLYIVGTNLGN